MTNGVTYTIDFAASIARLEEGAKQGAGAVKRMADQMEDAASIAKIALGALGGALTVQQFASAILGANQAQAAYLRLSEVAGTTAGMISSMALPAQLAGTSLESVAASVAKLGKSIGEARLGDAGKAGILKALGIDPQDGRDAAEMMVDVAKALSSFKDQTVAGKVANDLLGKSFAEIRPFMKELSEQGTLTARVTNEQAEAAKRFEDNLTRLSFASQQTKMALANELLPSLNHIAEAMVRAQREGGLLASIVAGIQTALTGTDQYKNDVAIVELTERKLTLENQVLAAQDQSRAYRGISLEKLKKQLADVNAQLQTVLGYSAMLATGAPGVAGNKGDGGAAGDKSAAESALLEQMKFEKVYKERVAAAQGFAMRYAEAIKTQNVLAGEAQKQGLLSEEGLIRQLAQNEDARLQVLIHSLEEEVALHKRKGELEAQRKAEERIALTEAQRVANDAITQAKITSGQDVREQQFQQGLAQRVAQIQIENTTEIDLLQAKFAERQNAIDLAAQAELITNDQYGALSAQNYAKFEKSKTDIVERESEARLNLIQNGLGQAAGMMQSKSRAMFEVGKAAAISQTVMDTYRGAQGAIAALSGIYLVGPFLAAAAAAGIITAGMARVQQIRSTPFGGGNVSGGGASPVYSANPVTGVPTAPISPVSVQPGSGQSPVEITVNIVTNGNIIGEDGIQRLVDDKVIPALQDAIGNRDIVIIGAKSRQASIVAPT